ncbi:thioredoxin [Dysgonomonas sp. Marseille-P4677]|uniref:thioredoxin n=1 Tax=Dysgonomonas sp. Marseille-P4677 TaxID=2364790 RepID=UPI0019136619|nr:thioredoxin [Dysgonomonas sp. Marseille-P4677]MBK5719353.1 thioredoxin [Dysgonomonas sp. Marseille-P4677]
MNKKILFRGLSLALVALLMLYSSNISAKILDEPKKDKSPIVTLSASNYSGETAKGLVFVDFWAAWCGPCRKMAPILDEVASEYKNSVKIGKLNVDNYKKFAIDNGIQALPTIVVYKDGKEVDRIMGLVSKDKLVEIIDKYSEKKAN